MTDERDSRPASDFDASSETGAMMGETGSLMPPESPVPSDVPAEAEFTAQDFAPTQRETAEQVFSVPASLNLKQERSFEDLSLAEMLEQGWRAPRQTWASLWMLSAPSLTPDKALSLPVLSQHTEAESPTANQAMGETDAMSVLARLQRDWLGDKRLLQLGLFLSAVVLAWFGNRILVVNAPDRTEAVDLASGAPFLLIAFVAWLGGEVVGHWQALKAWWQGLFWRKREQAILEEVQADVLQASPAWTAPQDLPPPPSLSSAYDQATRPEDALTPLPDEAFERDYEPFDVDEEASEAPSTPLILGIELWRLALVLFGLVLCLLVWVGTVGNQFSTPTFYLWIASMGVWGLVFAPRHWRIGQWAQGWWSRVRALDWRQVRQIVLALALIVVVAAFLRLDGLNGNPSDGTANPPEMTSDHVEKLLDAQRVKEGARNIFFANNGGREALHMYVLALFSELPGMGINHETLKTLAVWESLLSLPIFFWLGYEVMGERQRRWGVLVGLLLALLFAVSYWHLTVTRLALRIVMMPAVSALLLIYLVRAMRRNERADFIKAGLILGLSFYTYQASRMLPVVVVVGLALAFLWQWRTATQRVRLLMNGVVLVSVSFVAFIPLFHYSLENPDQFWRRTAGRLLGDDVVEERLPDGRIIERIATLEERLEAFNGNLPVLMNNLRNVLLMFNWKGDVGWINGVPNYPVLDSVTASLFIVGLAAWGAYVGRHWGRRQGRDVVLLFLPIAGFIMLLPSALAIAFPLENPSFTRTSGAMPMVLLLCALPLALIVQRLKDTIQHGRWWAWGVVVLVGASAYGMNSSLYAGEFYRAYVGSSLPYSEAGRILRGFAESDGAFGNAYMIAYPYWWDHRALGLAAGIEGVFPNGVYDFDASDRLTRAVDYVPHFMRDAFQRTDRFKYLPERDLLFFYAREDTETSLQLRQWFPLGRELEYPSYQPNDQFMLYRAPALGYDAFMAFINQNIPTTTP